MQVTCMMHEQTLALTQMGYSAFHSEAMLYLGKSPEVLTLLFWLFFMHLLPLNTAQHSLEVIKDLYFPKFQHKEHLALRDSSYTTLANLPGDNLSIQYCPGFLLIAPPQPQTSTTASHRIIKLGKDL